jgi:single-strand DNA-binding protein
MNVVWLIGNVVKDADPAVTSTGKKVANFRVATNEGFGEAKKTDYHTVVCWEKLAEEAHLSARTGVRVMVQGRLSSRSYESKKHVGEKVYVTEVVANSVRYLAEEAEEDLSGISFGS